MNKLLYTFFLFFILVGVVQSQDIQTYIQTVVDKTEGYRIKEGNPKKAIDTLQSVLAQLQAKGIYPDTTLVQLYHKIGINSYFYGDQITAEEYADKSIQYNIEKYGPIDIEVAKAYFMKAAVNKKMHNYITAQGSIVKAINTMEQVIENGSSTDTLLLIKIYNENIALNVKLKNLSLALEYWDKSFNYYNNKRDKYPSRIAFLHNQKAEIYEFQNNLTKAISNKSKAIDIYKKISSENDRSKINLALSYTNLAYAQTKTKRYTLALKNNNIAVNIFKSILEKNETPKLNQKIANTYCNQLKVANLIQLKKTELYFQKSLEHNLKGWGTFYHPRISELYRNKTKSHILLKEYTKALQANHKALQALIPTIKTEDPLMLININKHPIQDKTSFLETIQQKNNLLRTIYEKEGKKDINYLQTTYKNYQTLDTVITQIRQSYAQGSQFELIEHSYPIYEKAIAASLELYEKTKEEHYLESAYQFAAKNKALVLLSDLQDESAKSYSSIPEELLKEEKILKQSIYQLESKVYQLGDAPEATPMKDSLFYIKREYQKLIDRFEDDYADYFDAKYGFDKGLSVNEIQNRLPKGTAVLEYFIGDDHIFIFSISKEAFNYQKLEKPEGFDQVASAYRHAMETMTGDINEINKQGHQLYQWLLDESLLKINANHLVIIPDGILMQLPFDAFIQTKNGNDFLIRDYSVSYAYSNRLLFAKNKKHKAKYTFGGFGLEYDDYTLADLATYVNNPASSLPLTRALGQLQYSDDEIIEIADLLNGQQWINDKATRISFLENADQYAILHMAMHGIVNEDYPMNSALIFTRQNDSTEYFLRASDLYTMQLNADMAVLSACNTGAGTLNRGEGVRSLARSFSYAGCPSMVASLWNASDKSTKDILLLFYQNLKDGMSKDEAMRHAKLSYLETAPPAYQSPFYWSHLSVIGDSEPLEVLSISPWRKYGMWGAVATALLATTFYFRKRKAPQAA